MRTFAVVVAACVLAGTVGCVRVARDPGTGNADIDVESPLKRGEDWSGNIAGRSMYPNVRGTVRVVVDGGNSTITTRVTGLQPGGHHPWHLHEGTCETGGPIYGAREAYSPLHVGNDGTAEGTARLVDLKLNEARKYHVNIHLSASNMGTIIACGDVTD